VKQRMEIQCTRQTHNKTLVWDSGAVAPPQQSWALCEIWRKLNLFIPPRIVITKKCPRCQLRYRWREKQCTHCSDLTDSDVEKLKLQYQEKHKGNANLGRWFILFAVLIIIGIVLS
jgi:hypothetical protein